MECWKDDSTGMFSEDGFGENCSLYIDKMSNKTVVELVRKAKED